MSKEARSMLLSLDSSNEHANVDLGKEHARVRNTNREEKEGERAKESVRERKREKERVRARERGGWEERGGKGREDTTHTHKAHSRK